MTAAIDWSYNLLSEEERVVLRRLSVFPAAFTLKSACRIVETGCELTSPIETLASLVDKSLVTAERIGGAIAYRLLDTTRAYAMRKLADSDDEQWVRQRYAHTLDAGD